MDGIIRSVRIKPQKREGRTLTKNMYSRLAQRCNPMWLKSWNWAGHPIRSREDFEKKSTKVCGHVRNTSTTSPFTSTFMMSRRTRCDCGRSSPDAIGNDGAGWAEKVGP